jgi:hypothetical protein
MISTKRSKTAQGKRISQVIIGQGNEAKISKFKIYEDESESDFDDPTLRNLRTAEMNQHKMDLQAYLTAQEAIDPGHRNIDLSKRKGFAEHTKEDTDDLINSDELSGEVDEHENPDSEDNPLEEKKDGPNRNDEKDL